MKSKKILITVIALVVALLGAITALVVVLVNSNQSAKSNVTVTYVAEDVACEVRASYALIDISAANTAVNYFTSMKNETSSNTLTISEATASGTLNPSGDITLDKLYSRVVFKYTFTNTMPSTPLYVELTNMPGDTDNGSLENVDLLYHNSYYNSQAFTNSLGYAAGQFGLFSGVYDSEFNSSMGKLVVPALCTKYVHIIVSVDDLYANASFTGEIEWTLTRGEKPTTADVTAGSSLSLSNLYVGCEVTESDLNHSTVNIRTLDWYTDSSLSTKATFPVTTTESTTLYSSYLKGNIAEENLAYSGSSMATYIVANESLVTDATSTVAGYTPITSTDTTLVIPDMFEFSDGRIIPIAKVGDWYKDGAILLKDNTHVTTLYVGNNVEGFLFPSSGSCVLEDIYFGTEITEIVVNGDEDYTGDSVLSDTNNPNLTNLYFKEGTTTGWTLRNNAFMDQTCETISSATVANSTEILQQLKTAIIFRELSRFMPYVGTGHN